MTADPNFIENHLSILRNQGCRITPIVTAVLNHLCGNHKVRTASELQLEISSSLGYEVGSPTVYRICERLAKSGVLCSMHSSDGIMRYFICGNPGNVNHLHFICTRCKEVQEVECRINEQITAHVKSKLGAVVSANFVQVEGLCEECNA